MHLVIPSMISTGLAAQLCEALASAPFVDGQVTAGAGNGDLKHNLELADVSRVPLDPMRELMQAVRTNRLLDAWAIPRRSASLIFNRFDAGMYYRDHVDNPVAVIERQRHRSDLSMTLFLSPPESYEGGELVLNSDVQPVRVKLPAGDAVVYTTGVLHRVEEVTRGSRLACVTWIESMLRRHEQRMVMFDLIRARDALDPDAPVEVRQRLGKSIVNLMRMWTS